MHKPRLLSDADPVKALIGFGCSFGAKWFGGYARSQGRNFAATAAVSINRDAPAVGAFQCLDFLDVEPCPAPGVVLYLDPPYAGTTGYKYKLDHARFWAHAARWAEVTDVFVSEYSAPTGWAVVGEWSHALSVAGGSQANARIERLFHRRPDSA